MKKNERKIQRIPDAELDIMLILWENSRDGVYQPSKIIDVFKGMQSVRPCTRSAIHSLLDRLASRGFVKIEMMEDAPIAYKHITPLISEEEYREAESENFVDKLCRGNWKTLIATLVDNGTIGDSDIDEIEKLLKGGDRH
ncbi:MAG: BlaI/MecI/CopY family transcriptional regulator [Clostridia bacterium]|nr:BlaI/MecI/CopY family transcriptional regulator [Clostridia bacterium]